MQCLSKCPKCLLNVLFNPTNNPNLNHIQVYSKQRKVATPCIDEAVINKGL